MFPTVWGRSCIPKPPHAHLELQAGIKVSPNLYCQNKSLVSYITLGFMLLNQGSICKSSCFDFLARDYIFHINYMKNETFQAFCLCWLRLIPYRNPVPQMSRIVSKINQIVIYNTEMYYVWKVCSWISQRLELLYHRLVHDCGVAWRRSARGNAEVFLKPRVIWYPPLACL